MAVPYTFGSATTSIPLSQLDSNFATVITMGNTGVQLGNTITTLNNMTMANVTISSGTSSIQTNVANVTGVLIEANGGTGTTTGYYGFKNRIINGAMVIDQRNAGASVTANNGIFGVDRFKITATQSSKGTMQQNAGSVTPPAGFKNYLGLTSSSAFTPASGDLIALLQRIEGYNIGDLGWGASGASTVTLSFWVRSSLTGTFGGGIGNDAGDYTYPFSYTISSANTWEQKTITIVGPTSGTWLSTNGIGINLSFSLATGSTFSGTAGAWTGAVNAYNATGATQPFSTNAATWYITGVQLEKGSTATSFDYRPYGTEFLLCQRYYQALGNVSTSAYYSQGILGFILPVPMRASPTIAFSYNGTTNRVYQIDTGTQTTLTSPNVAGTSTALTNMYAQLNGSWAVAAGTGFTMSWTFAAEL